VRLRGADGADLTPRGQKARGALARLGTAPDLRLNRARLQDLLWSERGRQRGSDSLRQMLRELRTALGAGKAILLTGGGGVGLDRERLRIGMTPVDAAGGAPIESGADLDIPDPEFETWLRGMRLRLRSESVGPGAMQPWMALALAGRGGSQAAGAYVGA